MLFHNEHESKHRLIEESLVPEATDGDSETEDEAGTHTSNDDVTTRQSRSTMQGVVSQFYRRNQKATLDKISSVFGGFIRRFCATEEQAYPLLDPYVTPDLECDPDDMTETDDHNTYVNKDACDQPLDGLPVTRGKKMFNWPPWRSSSENTPSKHLGMAGLNPNTSSAYLIESFPEQTRPYTKCGCSGEGDCLNTPEVESQDFINWNALRHRGRRGSFVSFDSLDQDISDRRLETTLSGDEDDDWEPLDDDDSHGVFGPLNLCGLRKRSSSYEMLSLAGRSRSASAAHSFTDLSKRPQGGEALLSNRLCFSAM